jgi:membrane-associated phospholipid phosphatase
MPRDVTLDRRRALVGPLSLSLALLLVATPAAADDPGPLEADPLVDGLVIGGAALAGLGLFLLPVNTGPDSASGWDDDNFIFGAFDNRVRTNFAPRARILSDGALLAGLAVPAAFAIGTTWDAAAGDRALVFAESIAVPLLLTSAAKTLIGRARPYTFNPDAEAKRRVKQRGRDAYRSFFSGHAATTFAALAAGGALYAGRTTDESSRALAWGAGAAIASATANWRVRAGEHFYTDVIVGALVGSAAGTIIPAIHTGGLYVPSAKELGALAGGLVLGAALSELVPLGDAETAPTDPINGLPVVRAKMTPIVLPSGGAGLGLVGTF